MQAILCKTPGRFTHLEKEPPQLSSGHALVNINRIGICGTDIHAYAGNQPFFVYPRILGHELSGEVIAVDKDESNNISVGDKVVVIPYVYCGECVACTSEKTNCCEKISVIGVHEDGGMQEILSVPTANLISTNDLNPEPMAIVEPLAIGAHAIRRSGIKARATIVVVGCGPIGLGIIKQARILKAKVIAMDVNQHRLEIAKEKFGAHNIINPMKDPINHLRQVNNGLLANAVFDATGAKSALESGIDYMCHGGKYIIVGLNKGELSFHHPAIHAKESTIMCSRNATRQDFESVIEILGQGLFPVEDYITHKVGFSEMINHFDSWVDPQNGVIKAMVTL